MVIPHLLIGSSFIFISLGLDAKKCPYPINHTISMSRHSYNPDRNTITSNFINLFIFHSSEGYRSYLYINPEISSVNW